MSRDLRFKKLEPMLQWEVNRLDAENQKLRSQDPGRGELVDLQAELERAQGDVAGLTEELRICKHGGQRGGDRTTSSRG